MVLRTVIDLNVAQTVTGPTRARGGKAKEEFQRTGVDSRPFFCGFYVFFRGIEIKLLFLEKKISKKYLIFSDPKSLETLEKGLETTVCWTGCSVGRIALPDPAPASALCPSVLCPSG